MSFSTGPFVFPLETDGRGRQLGVGRMAVQVSAFLPEMAQSERQNNLFTFVGATFRFIVCLSMYLGLCLRAAVPVEISACISRPPVTR
jgi:hypothetical protein